MNAVTKEKYLLHTKLETARMILAFMCKEKLNQVAELFIQTCPYLQFERDAIEEGYAPFNFAYQPISEILHDYSQINKKVSHLVQQYGCSLSYPRTMSDLEKLEYLLELQLSGAAFLHNSSQQGHAPMVQTGATGNTLTISTEMLSQLTDGEPNKETGAVSFMLVPAYEETGTPATDGFSSGAKFTQSGTVNNYAIARTSNAPEYVNPSAVAELNASQGADGSAPAQYYLMSDTPNEQPIMIEIVPEDIDNISAPQTAPHTTEPVHIEYPTCVQPQITSYPVPVSQNEQEIVLQQQNSVVPPLSYTSYSAHSGIEGQCYRQANVEQHTLPVMQVSYEQNSQQMQINAMNRDEFPTRHSTGGSAMPSLNPTSNQGVHTEAPNELVTVDTTRIHRTPVPQSTENHEGTPSECRVSSTRKPHASALRTTPDSSSSHRQQKPTRNDPKTLLPSAAATNVQQEPESQPSPRTEDRLASAKKVYDREQALSAEKEWERIRSVNRSNFDDIAREEFCKVETQLRLEKAALRREKRKAVFRLVQNQPTGNQKPSPKQAVGRKRKQTLAARASAAKRKKQRISASDAASGKANDSLEQHAAVLEAALYTPQKPDSEPAQQQVLLNQSHAKEREVADLRVPGYVLQPVALSFTPATEMTVVQVQSEPTTNIEPVSRVQEDISQSVPQEVTQTTSQQLVPAPPEPPTTESISPNPAATRQDNVESDRPDTQSKRDDIMSANDLPPETEKTVASSEVAFQTPSECSPHGAARITSEETAMAVASIVTIATTTHPRTTPIGKKHLSDVEGSNSSDSSSGSSSSDSESNSSCSSTSSTTMEEDEDIRQMYDNAKRYRRRDRSRLTSNGRRAIKSTPPKPQYVGPLTQCVAVEAITVAREKSLAQAVPDRGRTISCASSKANEPKLPRIKIVCDRSQLKAKLVDQQHAQQPQTPKVRLTMPTPVKRPLPPAEKPAKPKPPSPALPDKATVPGPAPARTKTPRKQQLIPTKVPLDGTFIAPTPPLARQRLAQSSAKAPVRNRYASSASAAASGAASTTLPVPAKGKPTLTENRRSVRTVQTRRTKSTQPAPAATVEQTRSGAVEKQQQENTPVIAVAPTTTTTTTTTSSPSKAEELQNHPPEEPHNEDAIYAVLAQLHGK